ncbi:MAG: hypothetical protein WA945_04635 [Arcobacteraceae bacterium]
MISDVYTKTHDTTELRDSLIEQRRDEIYEEELTSNPTNRPQVSIEFTTLGNLVSQLDHIDVQLNEIFAVKNFNEEELKQEKEITLEINTLLEKTEIKLNKSDLEEVNKIDNRIHEIFEDGYSNLTETDELKKIKERKDNIVSSYEKPVLSKEDMQKLETLFEEIDTLYLSITPSKEALQEARELFLQKDEAMSLIDGMMEKEKTYTKNLEVMENMKNNSDSETTYAPISDELYFQNLDYKRDEWLKILLEQRELARKDEISKS